MFSLVFSLKSMSLTKERRNGTVSRVDRLAIPGVGVSSWLKAF